MNCLGFPLKQKLLYRTFVVVSCNYPRENPTDDATKTNLDGVIDYLNP